MVNRLTEEALRLAARGYAVFPCNGKTPLTPHGFKDASTDPDIIQAWWEKSPDANIGIACGASRLAVIDVDVKNGAPGMETWQSLLPRIGGQIDTPTVQTPTGGRHFYYLAPDGEEISQGNGKLGPGVDVKAAGGYVLAPPSIHPDTGTAYTWFDGYNLDDREILPLPDYFAHLLEKKQAPTAPRSVERDVFALGDDTRKAAKALQQLAAWRCDDYEAWLEVGMALSELGGAGFELWDKWSQGSDRYDPEACTKKWQTFKSGNGRTLGSLFHWAKEDAIEPPSTAPMVSIDPSNDLPEEPDYLADAPPLTSIETASLLDEPIGRTDVPGPAPAWTPERLTDHGNARRLVRLYGHELRYVNSWGWMVWDGRRWVRDETGAVMRYAKLTVEQLYSEANKLLDEAKAANERAQKAAQDGNNEELDKAQKEVKDKTQASLAFSNWAKKSQAAARLEAMVRLAQSELPVVALTDDFDAQIWALNCKNGTLDLQTGKLRPHNRADMLTKLCPVCYDPAAECPAWDRFQSEISADSAQLVGYKQRVYGYCLTGDVSEQVFFIAYGTGANGKSTEINTVRAILGPDYAWHIPTESLLTKDKSGGIPNDVARLQGMRFVTAIESDMGRRLAEGIVKQLTGGDPITARFMRAEFFTFDPTHKLILATNHKPEIWGSDHATWRRVKLIPYMVTIPKDRQDKDLPEKLKAEASGILAWLVRGCLAWQREGLKEPSEVTNATASYQAEQDIIGDFLADCCLMTPTAEVTKGELYDAYLAWCERNKESSLSKRKFSGKLIERGNVKDTRGTGGVHLWVGIGLISDVSDTSDPNSLLNGDVKIVGSRYEDNRKFTSLTSLTSLVEPARVGDELEVL